MQAEIEAALEKICSLVPSSYREECVAFVQEYTPEIVKLILSEVSPSEVCSALGLCSSIKGKSWSYLMEYVGSSVLSSCLKSLKRQNARLWGKGGLIGQEIVLKV